MKDLLFPVKQYIPIRLTDMMERSSHTARLTWWCRMKTKKRKYSDSDGSADHLMPKLADSDKHWAINSRCGFCKSTKVCAVLFKHPGAAKFEQNNRDGRESLEAASWQSLEIITHRYLNNGSLTNCHDSLVICELGSFLVQLHVYRWVLLQQLWQVSQKGMLNRRRWRQLSFVRT